MKKQSYEAPEMELTVIRIEDNFLESLNGGSTQQSLGIDNWTSTTEEGWDS